MKRSHCAGDLTLHLPALRTERSVRAMTPQIPTMERPAVEQPLAPVGAPIGVPIGAPASAPAMPPATAPITGYTGPAIGPMAGPVPGWYPVPVAAPQPVPQSVPSPAMRLGLAIASIALFIPLLALGIGSMTVLAELVAPGVAVTVGLIIVALVALTIVAVNLMFNTSGSQRPRR